MVGPVVKTLPFNAMGASIIPGWRVRILHTLQAKHTHTHTHTQNRNSIVINLIKILKFIHTEKSFLKELILLKKIAFLKNWSLIVASGYFCHSLKKHNKYVKTCAITGKIHFICNLPSLIKVTLTVVSQACMSSKQHIV